METFPAGVTAQPVVCPVSVLLLCTGWGAAFHTAATCGGRILKAGTASVGQILLLLFKLRLCLLWPQLSAVRVPKSRRCWLLSSGTASSSLPKPGPGFAGGEAEGPGAVRDVSLPHQEPRVDAHPDQQLHLPEPLLG